jgi:hypothetical protein
MRRNVGTGAACRFTVFAKSSSFFDNGSLQNRSHFHWIVPWLLGWLKKDSKLLSVAGQETNKELSKQPADGSGRGRLPPGAHTAA